MEGPLFKGPDHLVPPSAVYFPGAFVVHWVSMVICLFKSGYFYSKRGGGGESTTLRGQTL